MLRPRCRTNTSPAEAEPPPEDKGHARGLGIVFRYPCTFTLIGLVFLGLLLNWTESQQFQLFPDQPNDEVLQVSTQDPWKRATNKLTNPEHKNDIPKVKDIETTWNANIKEQDIASKTKNGLLKERFESLRSKSQPFGSVPFDSIVADGIDRGVLQHLKSGLCVHPKGGAIKPPPHTQLLLHGGCFGEDRLQFHLDEVGKLTHLRGDVCVRPDSQDVADDTALVFAKKCDDEGARFLITSEGSLQHIKSKFCVKLRRGGVRNSELLLSEQACGDDDNAFGLVRTTAVSVEKVVAGPPPIINDPEKLPKKVAVSILITKDPGLKNGFLDSAAAMAQAISEIRSEFLLDLLAIVSPDVTTVRPALKRMGYRVIERPLPVPLDEIKNEALVRDLAHDGCCGAWEFLKLWAWTMHEYDRVLQVDADIHFHQNFDEVFKYNVTLSWTHGALGGSEVMNGGFLVVRPNQEHFDQMTGFIREGKYTSRGWLGLCCRTYGGRTIQGLVPAFYIHHLKADHFEVDRCRFNNMVEIDRCKMWRFEDVKSNHFTVCQKPWVCHSPPNSICQAFTDSWWSRLQEVKKRIGYPVKERCSRGYEAIDWGAVDDGEVLYKNQIVNVDPS